MMLLWAAFFALIAGGAVEVHSWGAATADALMCIVFTGRMIAAAIIKGARRT